METNNGKIVKKDTTPEQREAIIESWKESGKSKKEFCRESGIHYCHKFYLPVFCCAGSGDLTRQANETFIVLTVCTHVMHEGEINSVAGGVHE